MSARLRVPVGPGDHTRGPSDAPITLVEYGDFECPFCGRAYWEVERLLQAMGDRVRFVFRHFPLTQVHPHALAAAEAAEAAGAQGKFWEMHGMLYRHQDNLEYNALLAYADAIDCDLERFTDDLRSHRHRPKIQRDFMSGVRSGVAGTPTFFINGYRHDGEYTAEALLAAMQGEEVPARF